MLQNWIINSGKLYFKYELYQISGKNVLENKVFWERELHNWPQINCEGKLGTRPVKTLTRSLYTKYLADLYF